MKLRHFVLALLFSLTLPSLALADGSQSYTTPGSYTFTVPNYSGILTVTVNGAGGSGGGGGGSAPLCQNSNVTQGPSGSNGDDGGNSSFGSVVADGGGGGTGGAGNGSEYTYAPPGNPGSAGGGDQSVSGGGSPGGSGGPGATDNNNDCGGAGFPGGNGGNGGQAVKSYQPTTLAPGTRVTVTVGEGGGGGGGGACPNCADTNWQVGAGTSGGSGGDGSITIMWTDAAPSQTGGPSCSVTFAENPLTDSSTTMTWDSSGATLFYINNVGYVGATGTAEVFSPGDYTGYVAGNGSTASCPATLLNPNSVSNTQSNDCVATQTTCEADGNLQDSCGNVSDCRFGCSSQTNTCNSSCVPADICDDSGTMVVNSCTGAVIYNCGGNDELCADAQCVAPSIYFDSFETTSATPFEASGHLQAVPDIVRAGEQTNLYWNVVNAASCTVVGTNGGSWSGSSSGPNGVASGAIKFQTAFTLQCSALSGATPSTVVESVTVNVPPSFQEL